MVNDARETFEMDDHLNEVERYERREAPAYVFAMERRTFVQSVGAGVMFAVMVRPSGAQRRQTRADRAEAASVERLIFSDDGTVTVFTSKVEVGQGSRTQLTQAAAEELRLPVECIQIVMADTAKCPDDGGTAGSRTTPSTVPRIRQACAAVREKLIQLAAQHFRADPSSVRFDGTDFHVDAEHIISLQDLIQQETADQPLTSNLPDHVDLPGPDQWRVLGHSTAKIASAAIVTGQHAYPSDIRLPNMLYGKILRPPSFAATLESIDLTPAENMESVVVVRDGDFVGCAAETRWRAQKAVEAIAKTARWSETAQTSSDELFRHLKRTASAEGSGRNRARVQTWGDGPARMESAAQRIAASYEVAYIQHAPMEPRAAVANWTDGKLTVWTGSQQPARVHGELCRAFSLPEERVRVVVPDTGGGFGGKHTGEAALEAARLSAAANRPVSLRWTREEEFTWAYFRPAGLIEVEAGLDDTGRLTVWDFSNYNSGGSALDSPYRVPHGRTRFLPTDAPLRQGSYRALASTANTFAREAMMDELAAMADADPLDFRLSHLQEGRLRAVLQAAAERFQWRDRRRQKQAIGLACGTEKGSYVAACAEVEITDQRIRVKSICQAYECGAIQNPENLKSQVEGCVVMGLGAALSEAMEYENGKITNASFYDYQVPRMDWLPELDFVLVDRPDLPSVGAGETPIIAVAPAIANAVFAATGQRLRSLPMRLS